VADDDQLLRVLKSIDRRLALMTGAQERDMRHKLVGDVLRTPSRLRMFDGIDGRTGSPDLAKAAGVSERAAQQFVQDLMKLGLVKVVGGTSGRGFLVAKDEDAIVKWYLEGETTSTGELGGL
jgi:hypothetical protein